MSELTNEQIRAIIISRRFFEKNYASMYPRIIQLFCTDPEKRGAWHGYNRSQKKTHLLEHLADLERRSLKDIAEIVAPELSEQCGLSAVKLALRRAAEDGYLSRGERHEELIYRRSILGKLAYENDPKDGSKAFGWNKERLKERMESLRERFAQNVGITFYDNNEMLLLIRLAEDKEYQHPKGTIYSRHPNWRKIQKIMADSGYNRTDQALRCMYSKINTDRKKRVGGKNCFLGLGKNN